MNLKYVTYYENLVREFHTPEELQKQLEERYRNAWGESILGRKQAMTNNLGVVCICW